MRTRGGGDGSETRLTVGEGAGGDENKLWSFHQRWRAQEQCKVGFNRRLALPKTPLAKGTHGPLGSCMHACVYPAAFRMYTITEVLPRSLLAFWYNCFRQQQLLTYSTVCVIVLTVSMYGCA